MDKSLMENATREQLFEALNKVLEIVEKHDEAEWLVNAPDYVEDNDADEGWYKGQLNGQSLMANEIEGTILVSLRDSVGKTN